jgi:hypothetical protein
LKFQHLGISGPHLQNLPPKNALASMRITRVRAANFAIIGFSFRAFQIFKSGNAFKCQIFLPSIGRARLIFGTLIFRTIIIPSAIAVARITHVKFTSFAIIGYSTRAFPTLGSVRAVVSIDTSIFAHCLLTRKTTLMTVNSIET